MADKRYRISVDLKIEDTTAANATGFYESSVTYHDAPRDVMLAVEKVLLEAQGKLLEMGFQQAESDKKK